MNFTQYLSNFVYTNSDVLVASGFTSLKNLHHHENIQHLHSVLIAHYIPLNVDYYPLFSKNIAYYPDGVYINNDIAATIQHKWIDKNYINNAYIDKYSYTDIINIWINNSDTYKKSFQIYDNNSKIVLQNTNILNECILSDNQISLFNDILNNHIKKNYNYALINENVTNNFICNSLQNKNLLLSNNNKFNIISELNNLNLKNNIYNCNVYNNDNMELIKDIKLSNKNMVNIISNE